MMVEPGSLAMGIDLLFVKEGVVLLERPHELFAA
jgi:hypothetical protein